MTEPSDPYAEARRAGPPDKAKPPPRWRRGKDITDSAVRSAAAARAVGARDRLPGGIPEGDGPQRSSSGIPGLAALGRAATGQRQGEPAPLSDVRPFRVIESYPGSGVRPVGSNGGLGGPAGSGGSLRPAGSGGGQGGGGPASSGGSLGPAGSGGGQGGGGPAGGALTAPAGRAGGGRPAGASASGTVRQVFPSASADQATVENERARIGRGGTGPVVFGETKEDAGAISDLPGSFGKGTGLTNRRRLPSGLAAGMARPLQSGRHPRAASWDSPSRTMGLRRPLTVLLALVVLGGIYVAVQALRGAPRPSLVEGAQVGFTIPGAPPVLPWPSTGESEVQVEGVGTFGPVGETTPVAMGSVAKIMAAYVILHDHPLALGQQGPSIPITTADVAIYNADLSQGDSVVPVTAGQSFTELQALQALLVPSGDNIAELLATWDTGSEAAFVAKMNAEAASLGMSHTHYADVSGISSGTVSTAADQLILAPLAMANATFAATVGLTQIDLPSGGLLTNYNSLLGTDGIDGIKTGSVTSGDLVFSAKHTVGGHTETIYGAVLGVIPAPGQGDIPAATSAGQLLVKAVEADVAPVRVLAQGTVEAHVSAPWLDAPVPVSTDKAVTALGWPGLTVKVSASPSGKLARSIPSGAVVGRATVEVGLQRSVVALRTTGPIPGPSLGWRLTRL